MARPASAGRAFVAFALNFDGLFPLSEQSLHSEAKKMMTDQCFPLGQIIATPGALEAIEASGEQPLDFIKRHASGDWGEVDQEDREANEQALMHGARLLSAYQTNLNQRLWIITEANRSATTILLPEEY